MKPARSGLRRTKDYSRIKNFLKCNETSGTAVYLDNGDYLSDAALAFTTDNGGGVRFTTNQGQIQLASGDWDVIGDVDMIFMLSSKHVFGGGLVTNFQIGNSPNQNFHVGGGAAGIESAVVGADGAHTTQEVTTDNTQYDPSDYFRLVWKGTFGVKWEFSWTGTGVPVSFQEGGITGSGDTTWDATGKCVNFGDDAYFDISANNEIILCGLTMVEFPNGFPSDLDARINATFDAWEAGNKIHFPVYEDE